MAGNHLLSDGNNLEVAEKMLRDVTGIFDFARLDYWLEGGTLLGIMREQRLLPWDNDMDISIFDHSKRKLWIIIPLLIIRGYRLTFQNHQADMGPFKKGQLRILKIRNFSRGFKKGPVTLDIFFKRELEENCFWVVGIKNRILKSTPARFTTALRKVDFQGKDYLIPKDFDSYLSYRYADWKTPQKEWDFRTDDQAIVKRDY